jgi:hypothetical protein
MENVWPRIQLTSSDKEYSGADTKVMRILFVFVKLLALGGGPSNTDSQALTTLVLLKSGLAGG